MQNENEVALIYLPMALADSPLLKSVLMQMGVNIRTVGPSQTGQTVGFLAGLYGFAPQEEGGSPIPDPMLVLCGFTSQRLDLLLKNLRTSGAPPIHYKAVLTEHNCAWTLFALYKELKSERDAIARRMGMD